ncbi:MAG: SufD family Fe-S cluster assembly protein [Sphingomonadales bacterium]|nr:SufD family Fe-S cluster assembly protein [Sphingomonadales bacterium]
MTVLTLLPTRKAEAWRYADIAALSRVWDDLAAPEEISVAAGETKATVIDTLPPSGIRRIDVAVGDGGLFALHCLVAGVDYGRVEIRATLGRAAHFELGGAILGNGDQTLEIVTETIHAAPNGTSNQVVRQVLAGKATGTYMGKVAVARDAQKIDAAQSVKAMLLDRSATANAKPELEIYADDVKCAHGATVGELDKAALFYMASRGLPPEIAQRLMLQAFIADAFLGMGDDAAREAIEAKALGILEGLA